MRAGSRPVRMASAARGIGGVDSGAQRCAEHVFFSTLALCVCSLRSSAGCFILSSRPGVVCLQLDVKAHAGHRPLSPAPAGLLAVAALATTAGRWGGASANIGRLGARHGSAGPRETSL